MMRRSLSFFFLSTTRHYILLSPPPQAGQSSSKEKRKKSLDVEEVSREKTRPLFGLWAIFPLLSIFEKKRKV